MRIALRSIGFCIALAFMSPLNAATQTKTDNIIYEYEVITQQKGESLSSVLKSAKLSTYQFNLVDDLPIRRDTPEARDFRLSYALQDGKRLLREVKVTRGNKLANFVLSGSQGNHKFVSKASEIPSDKLRAKPQLTSLGSAVSLTSTRDTLYSMSVSQSHGESLSHALQELNLSKTQKSIVNTGDFVKTAASKRTFTLFFVGSKSKKLLRGLSVKRGSNRADYLVESQGDKFQLRNLKTISDSQRSNALARFKSAKQWEVDGSQTASIVSSNSTSKFGKNKNVINSGKYRLVRLTQNKGKSISSAMNGFSFTSVQRQLINDIPVTKSAKSTRYFYLLFETSGNSKYLKAVRVERSGASAEYVLAKNSGVWEWANSKGQITTSGGFLRNPLNYKRISSGFNLRRRHPVTGRIRPHKGTDFAAPRGTPVWAPAAGVVTFSGRQSGYGLIVEIDHGNGYKTKYGHLSRIMSGAKKGMRVKKRQVIANVGNTGISTGPHLHYEVHVNGVARNPRTVRLPGGGGTKTLSSAKKSASLYLPKIRQMIQ